MDYLAVLGRETELSLAELQTAAGEVTPFGNCALLHRHLDINHLGGVIKLARVISQPEWRGLENLEVDISKLPFSEGKNIVGVSLYGAKASTKAWALKLKKKLKTKGSVRIVADAAPLTAAQLKFNQVLAKGFELIIAVMGDRAVLALTESFQDIDWYSRRDYDRPKRDAKVGMLPPKLAQIMINLSGGDKIYDPFCGTGVVLQEALLLGKPTQGSDLEPKMIEYTEANLKWLAAQIDHPLPSYSAETADARTVKIPSSFSIVSEGYLGPPLHHTPDEAELATLRAELAELYLQCLTNWSGQLESGSRHVLAVPCWRLKQSDLSDAKKSDFFETLPLIDHLTQIGYNLVRFKNADSRKLIYARSDQLVGRQILVLEKT